MRRDGRLEDVVGDREARRRHDHDPRDAPRVRLPRDVAREASGDMYGADVARALRERFPRTENFGLGGQRMREAGVDMEFDISHTAVVGPFEAIAYFGTLYRVFRRLADRIEADPPTAAILIDFPDFNLRLAKRLKDAGVPVVYYISPQVWAWREGRIKQIRQLVDKMLVIFPFEEEIYQNAGVDVEFVGHPLVDTVKPTATKEEFCKSNGSTREGRSSRCSRAAEKKKCIIFCRHYAKPLVGLPQRNPTFSLSFPWRRDSNAG